ncbi:hypothetical protein DICVIV_10521 [Dictyocaulus viviparus]|uniref:Thioredoxin domain-containing protein n=1 Tax=Dictyocaulus viviparus TaxID=29172 RepID=A0A0D8XI57_DICVI|nr:hypothetical protein DICVIV_10521 [Dictyocaulus viviparus]
MFGGNWCPYSQELLPIFSEASYMFKQIHPSFDVIWANVECMEEVHLCQLYFISKYPTIKIFIRGDMMNKEYRARRAVDDLVHFVAEQYEGSIREFVDDNDLMNNMNTSAHNVVAYIKRGNDAYQNFYSIAQLLRDYCTFWIQEEKMAENLVKFSLYYKPPEMNNKLDFDGNLHNYTLLKQWVTDKCIQLVREITFENAEDLTEEGLPFLIYFRDPRKKEDDKFFTEILKKPSNCCGAYEGGSKILLEPIQLFDDQRKPSDSGKVLCCDIEERVVARELYEQRMTVIPLLADGFKFAHPLHHLGKTIEDLPVLAIDSFTHMFIFPNISRLSERGALKQFVDDLYSENCHKHFHGEIVEEEELPQNPVTEQSSNPDSKERQENESGLEEKDVFLKSIFRELKPSEKRYSLLDKTEL